MQTEYNLSWILPYVRESLRGRGNLTFDGFADGVFAVLERVVVGEGIEKRSPSMGYTGYTYNFDAAHPDIRFAVTEAFYYLEQNRFILRPPPTHAPAFVSGSQCQITKRGQEWANGVEPLPEDYNGYMNGLNKLIPNLDKVIAQYVSEGLSSFVRERYFASAVMIGAASEKAIYLLADSMLGSFKDAARHAKLEKLLANRGLNALFTFVEKTILDAHDANVIPYPVMEGTSRHLMSLFESVRVQRNDAVHPMNAQVSADSVRLSFGAFPHAFRESRGTARVVRLSPKEYLTDETFIVRCAFGCYAVGTTSSEQEARCFAAASRP